MVPSVVGQTGRLTLTALVPNGTRIKAGDILAEFDRTQQLENARDAQAKFEDFDHQVEQKIAQNRAEAEERASNLQQAEADVAKALLQIRKGPVLAEVDRLSNEASLRIGRERSASLQKSNHSHDLADAAALRILELRRDRQKVALERALGNAEKLVVRAPLAGMVAHENTYRGNSMGPPQEGDLLYPGYPLIRIFDAAEMDVVALVAEPDGAVLTPGTPAEVRLDAYPDLVFRAEFSSASPVASSGYGSSIKTFMGRFRLLTNDPRLLPDLSAAVIVPAGGERPAGGGGP
jgi:multidrug resistance efflux pump